LIESGFRFRPVECSRLCHIQLTIDSIARYANRLRPLRDDFACQATAEGLRNGAVCASMLEKKRSLNLSNARRWSYGALRQQGFAGEVQLVS
jgi:hypothetical protein